MHTFSRQIILQAIPFDPDVKKNWNYISEEDFDARKEMFHMNSLKDSYEMNQFTKTS